MMIYLSFGQLKTNIFFIVFCESSALLLLTSLHVVLGHPWVKKLKLKSHVIMQS